MVYITGDTHGYFDRIAQFCRGFRTDKKDIMIILGDAGINYYNNIQDVQLKLCLQRLPITLFCIHGNHEKRPDTIETYKLKDFLGGKVWVEDKYSNIVFAKDGEIYNFPYRDKTIRTIVIGGAYSVDKFYRLGNGLPWFDDEQPSEEIKGYVENQLDKEEWKIDCVLSHTCPLKYEPKEWFLTGLDQSTVDKSTEIWLNKIEDKLEYQKWYCGHYHGRKEIDKIRFMFKNFALFME